MKFINLLKKELKELLTFQTIIGMVVILVLFSFLGEFMGGVMEDSMGTSEINLCVQDDTVFTKNIVDSLIANPENQVNIVEVNDTDRSVAMKALGIDNVIIIPEGFSDRVLKEKKPAELEIVTVMESTSLAAITGSGKTSDVMEVINSTISEELMTSTYGLTANDIETIKTPVVLKEVTVVGEKSAPISTVAVASFAMTQGIVVPIVIFVLVIFAAQMIISAISTEKIDKTLETLLSAPVSRVSVLSSKMLAATIVALLNAGVYMFAFSNYMNSMMGGKLAETGGAIPGGDPLSAAMATLGLELTTSSYVLLGLQMFMTIMIALAVSLILGAMATDMKSAQTLLMPIMVCAMIPYMLSLFTSINQLPIIAKLLIYAIPFTHTFTAIENLLFGNMSLYWFGLGYQVILFGVFMFLAVRLFTSDKIFTISLNFGQKAKVKKARALLK